MRKAFWLVATGLAFQLVAMSNRGAELWKKLTKKLRQKARKPRKSTDGVTESGKTFRTKERKGIQGLSNGW
jgi:hypothetical protein